MFLKISLFVSRVCIGSQTQSRDHHLNLNVGLSGTKVSVQEATLQEEPLPKNEWCVANTIAEILWATQLSHVLPQSLKWGLVRDPIRLSLEPRVPWCKKNREISETFASEIAKFARPS